MKAIILIWAVLSLISYILMYVGIIRCANYYGWRAKISKEGNEFIMKTFLITLFVPGWNLVRTLRFAINPLKYVP